ncbi:MAG: hypothetical protein IBX69_18615 [Anaerolineales bacterium]|nr:hypothetical protein [Anaerolineales bacterium]
MLPRELQALIRSTPTLCSFTSKATLTEGGRRVQPLSRITENNYRSVLREHRAGLPPLSPDSLADGLLLLPIPFHRDWVIFAQFR